jgi:hypothetical protein
MSALSIEVDSSPSQLLSVSNHLRSAEEKHDYLS